MKNFIKFIVITAVLLTGIIAYLGNFMLEVAVHPEDDLRHQYDTCYAQIYRKYPEMKVWHDTLVEKGNWRDTMLVAQDGMKRHGMILRHDSLSKGATIVLHGYNDNAPRMMRYAYLHYEILGRDVIIPEHCNHGLSEGDHIRFGWLDRLDITGLWIPLTHKLWPTEKIIVHGLSMGGALTMFTSGEDIDESLNVIGFIEDCGYSSTWEQLAYQLKEQYALTPFPLLYVANWWCNMKYGWDMKESDALKQLAKCDKPMFFIHGDADDFVPFSMLQQNYNAKTQGYKEIWVVPGAKHARSIHEAWEEYCQRCEEFIYRCDELCKKQ